MQQRYGEMQVSSVGTFTTFKPRGALKDIDRQRDNNFDIANKMTKIIQDDDLTIKDVFKRAAKNPALKAYIKSNSDIFHMMPALLNQPKVRSIHACAKIIFPDVYKATEWAPMRMMKGMLVSEFEGNQIDDVGFLKEDILGIKLLEKFSKILERIGNNGKKIPDIYNIPLDDREVYRFFCNGWNGDVFQLGSDGLTTYCKSLKPRTFDDLVAAVALYRPGPMENHYHEIYAKCKNEGRKVEFLWGTEEITKDTYGILCYQEQIMEVCKQIGGLSLVEADSIRKAMGKKLLEVLKPWKSKVVEGAISRGCPEDQAEHMWEVMLEFAKYSFNKSHSVVYAYLAYIGQWLKVYYPLEYWSVALDYADKKKQEDIKYLSEINISKQIKLVSADINSSGVNATTDPETNTIFWGISSIKGIGEATARQIVGARNKLGPYTSFAQFQKIHTFTGSKVKKQIYEALISSGAFDDLYGFENTPEKRLTLIKRFRRSKKVKSRRGNLNKIRIEKFKISNPKTDAFTIGNIYEPHWWQLKQKELTGLVFFNYTELLGASKIKDKQFSIMDVSRPARSREWGAFGGYIVEVRERSSKRGKFGIVTIEHNYNLFTVMVWSEEWKKWKDEIKPAEGSILLFSGFMSFDEKYGGKNQFTLSDESKVSILN